jgi:hypothetical protein
MEDYKGIDPNRFTILISDFPTLSYRYFPDVARQLAASCNTICLSAQCA